MNPALYPWVVATMVALGIIVVGAIVLALSWCLGWLFDKHPILGGLVMLMFFITVIRYSMFWVRL